MGKRAWILLAAAAVFVCLAAPRPALADEPSGMVGTQTCGTCHEDQVKAFAATPHAQSALGCEGCHGPGQAHVDGGGDKTKIRNFKTLTPSESSAVCLTCHNKGMQSQWIGSTHDSRKLACVTCHDPHPKGAVPKALLRKPEFDLCTSCHLQRKAQLFRSGHMPMREGKMNCTSCHNPHGSTGPAMLLQNSVNENCYSCHAEKRGPFLWEHAPVRENCLTCHDPHGSIQDNLLRMRPPILCQQCHTDTRHPSQIHTPADRFAFNHGCVNCHAMIHGSNSPSGQRFER